MLKKLLKMLEAVNDVEKVAEDVKTVVDNILGDGKVDEV